MHIDFDLKSPCPVARIFLLLLAPDTQPDTPCIRTSTAMPTHVGAALPGAPEQALLRRRETRDDVHKPMQRRVETTAWSR